MFQDMYRTVRAVERNPEIMINGDFSHWYTGQEMPYGDWEQKLAFIQPVFDRVGFLFAASPVGVKTRQLGFALDCVRVPGTFTSTLGASAIWCKAQD